jgi:SAM-dependent methyltransferase
MQAYNSAFARIYNQRWADHARTVAPFIRMFYESTEIGAEDRRLLDICCGTGQLAVHFLEHHYRVVGLDLSDAMLDYARQNAARWVEGGQARFVQGDAAAFDLDDRFGLAVSTYDALNHLPDEEALRACSACVHRVLVPGGTFLFDLNTRACLKANWNGVRVQNTEELFLMDSGFCDEQGNKAWVKITGFVRIPEAASAPEDTPVHQGVRRGEGLYERFEQIAYNTIFDLAWVQDALRETGYSHVHCAHLADLSVAVENPEAAYRIYLVAIK